MSKKKVSEHELDTILRTISLFPDGCSLEKIITSLELPLTRRTLQRRLDFLAKNNLLQIDGQTRGRLYRLRQKQIGAIISLSSEGLLIQNKITAPLQTRPYASYNREFLDKYRPNETFYLPLKIRDHLLQLGKSPVVTAAAGTYARQLLGRLLIDLSWNSSRLEGNTYSLLETKRLLELGETAEGKNSKDAQMILNHKAAIEFLVDSAKEAKFNRYTIQSIHALLSNNLLEPGSCGRLRNIPVGISQSVYQPPEIPQLISECFQQVLDTANAIENPFEQAFFAMVHLPYLQPFEDVNKRVSRIAANLPLIHHNLCPLSFVDVSETTYINGLLGVYELNRVELLIDIFVWAYERSSLLYTSTRKTLGEPDPFRLKYRDLIMETMGAIVRGCMDKKSTVSWIKQQSNAAVDPVNQSRFIEVVETEVTSLHEGNIARYRLRPSEYEAWRKSWKN
jgi:fido (protein-threonine AMPylation protein)